MKLKLDLHGIPFSDANLKVEKYLIGASFNKNLDVEIITGKSGEMKQRIIKEVLEPHKFLYYIPVNNPGVIRVTEDALFI